MSEMKEGHQSEDMAEEATNQGRKDGDSTEKEVFYPEGGCSRSKDSTKTKEEKSHLSEASVENPGDGINNLSTIKKLNSENCEGETPLKSCEEENKDEDPAQKEQHMVTAATASSSESANPDVKNGSNSTIQNRDSAENKEKNEKGCSPDMGANVKNPGDCIQESPKNESKSENSEGETPLKSCEEENKDDDPAQKEQHMVTAATAPSSESANPDVKNGSDSTIQNRDSAENKEKNEKRSPDMGADVKNSGDCIQESPKNEPKSDKSHTTKQEAPKTTTSATPDDKKHGQEDGTKTSLNEEIPDTNDTDAESGDGGTQERTPSPQITSFKQQLDEDSNDVETIGPTTPEATEPVVPEITEGKRKLYPLLAVGMVVVFAILVQHFIQQESPPQTNDLRQIDIFLRNLEKVKTLFPNQRAELWDRSRIHLKRHLQTAQPTEPVSLILTAGVRAERTLNCLAHGLASAFSSALNASFLHIDGTSKASQDSDQVKLDIDRKLQGAFEGDKPVAIIHRFEELPPGSTLIFYRYCDHENAAYKKTFLIFTVLLGEEEEIPAKISLSAVEEMVDDHLQKKFLSHGQPVSFDMMDLDKYGGLWSRISHLILPVATEKRIELEGC